MPEPTSEPPSSTDDMPVDVRNASPTDRATLLAFHRALYVDHRDEIVDPKLLPLYAYRDFEKVLRQDVDGLLQSPACVVLVAASAGEDVGYISGRVETDPRRALSRRGIIEDWYVRQDARGRGVGGALFRRLVAVFEEAGCDLVESATWPANTGARAVHETLGFRETLVQYRMRLGGD